MRVAVLQFSPTLGVVAPNLARILSAIDDAARAQADLLVAPEMSLTGWTLADSAQRAALVASVHTAALPALRRAAVSRQMGVLVGGPGHSGDVTDNASASSAANSVFALSADGSLAVYRKIHLFEDERAWWVPGDAALVADLGGVRVGVTICYDAEFPEVPRVTRLAGAEMLVVPTTNMTPYERDQDVVFATRAIENEIPVVVANRVGTENGWNYFGRSVVMDRSGRVVAQAGSEEELLIADIDLSAAGDPGLSYLSRRRPQIYSRLLSTIESDRRSRSLAQDHRSRGV